MTLSKTFLKSSYGQLLTAHVSVGGAFILPGDWIKQSGPIASSIGIVIGALLMILIAVSYGALVEKFPVSGEHLLLVS